MCEMTVDEAIKYLTPIAESASLPNYVTALTMAISALRAKQEDEKNDPLTLEELEELKYNEPIWIERIGSKPDPVWIKRMAPLKPYYPKSEWHLFISVNLHAKTAHADGALCIYPGPALDLRGFGKKWLAYRRPPEVMEQ